jgi:chemotaxis protein methyltransferase CheR
MLRDLETTEMMLLIEGIKRRYGYDFTHYSQASLKRRLMQAMGEAGIDRFTRMLDLLFHDDASFDRFLKHMSVTVTDMYRDPQFYRTLREGVMRALKTYPFVKIWHAGCATGEEVYSMAIMLEEEDFLCRTRIYATDFNKYSLDTGRRGVYPSAKVSSYAANYRAAGGRGELGDYFSDGYDLIKFKDQLKERITFSYHNLVTDGVFGEMNLICCRNVLIYFDKDLQNQVLGLLANSLRHGGFLCLGTKESLKFSAVEDQFEPFDRQQRIYKKVGGELHV